ncbi:MAG TPA: GAF domain-containing protein [Bryobacteraceae bacterium]|nr:GAF domain-containing protein [Bryobacteraceae bacterium]
MPKIRDMELRMVRLEQELHLFQRISRLMVRENSLQQVLQSIVALLVEYLQCDSCIIYLTDGAELVLCASNTAPLSAIGRVRLSTEEGLTGWVARNRRLVALSRDAFNDPRFKSFSELEADTYEAFLSAPVIARNRVVGVINVQHREPHSYTGDQMELLTTVGEQVGCLLLLARLDREALDRTVSIEQILGGGVLAGSV